MAARGKTGKKAQLRTRRGSLGRKKANGNGLERQLAERAARLTDSPNASLLFKEGDVLRVMAVNSHSKGKIPPRGHEVPIRKTYGKTYVMGRAVLNRRSVHVEDVVPLLKNEYQDARENQRKFGFRTVLGANRPEG